MIRVVAAEKAFIVPPENDKLLRIHFFCENIVDFFSANCISINISEKHAVYIL